MSKRNSNEGLNILYILFLAALSCQDVNLVSASTSAKELKGSEIENTIKSTSELVNSEINFNSSGAQPLDDRIEQDIILTDISIDRLLGKNPEDSDDTGKETSPVLKLIRQISLFFFLLFFVPFGLFYPFFLFYKNLFDIDDEDRLAEEAFESSVTIPSTLIDEEPEIEEYSDQATFSQLQIAFSPEVRGLKQQLKQINSRINRKSNRRMIELMRQTASVLNTQEHWSHSSYSSVSYPIEEIQTKFDLVLSTEKDKCMKRELSIINNEGQTKQSDRLGVRNPYQYTVVTLMFCTSDNTSWFEQIDTKEQLAEELTKLSKMPKENLINFKLLWNPQREGEFISNDQLLIDYENMVRLF